MPGQPHPNEAEHGIGSIESRLRALEEALERVNERNQRVESDKAWEGSKTRIALICAITYVVASGVIYTLGSPRWFLDAIVPTLGFFLSSQSIPLAKKYWTRSYLRNKN
jgi:hypothetical protein